MPEAQGWKYGDFAEVVVPISAKDLGFSMFMKDLPKFGDVGVVSSINTRNGVVTTVGVEFNTRSWVIPVKFLAHE